MELEGMICIPPVVEGEATERPYDTLRGTLIPMQLTAISVVHDPPPTMMMMIHLQLLLLFCLSSLSTAFSWRALLAISRA